jgi:hypothetical protein
VAPPASAAATASAQPKASPAASGSAAPPPSASAAPAPALSGIEELRRTRPDRRRAELTALRERWGDLVAADRAKDELKLHAQRSAYLQRMRALADQANDPKFVASVDKLITQEERRDADAMNALRSGAAAPASGGKP